MHRFPQLSSKEKKLYTASLLLTLTAIVVTIILIHTHFENSESGSFCNISDYWNCDRVNKSTFAELFGVPVSIFGFLFYGTFAILQFLYLKTINIEKFLPPIFTTKRLAQLSLLAATFSGGFLMYQEITYLGLLIPWGIIKNLIFMALPIWFYTKAQTVNKPETYYAVFLLILALFGFNFALYLTNIELFVLEAICIFCFSQQVLILIISILLYLGFKKTIKQQNG